KLLPRLVFAPTFHSRASRCEYSETAIPSVVSTTATYNSILLFSLNLSDLKTLAPARLRTDIPFTREPLRIFGDCDSVSSINHRHVQFDLALLLKPFRSENSCPGSSSHRHSIHARAVANIRRLRFRQ